MMVRVPIFLFNFFQYSIILERRGQVIRMSHPNKGSVAFQLSLQAHLLLKHQEVFRELRGCVWISRQGYQLTTDLGPVTLES